MGIVIRQSFWGTAVSYVGVMVGYVNTLYFRAEYFDLAQIGLFTLITANAMIVSSVSSLGMGSSYIKFFPAFKEDQHHRFFSFLFLITVAGNVIMLAVGYAMKDFIASRYVDTAPSYVGYLSITAIIIVVNSLFDLLFNYSRSIMKIIFPSFLREIYLRLGSLVLVIGFAWKWWDFHSAVLGLSFVYSLALIFLFIQLAFYGFRFDFHVNFISKQWRFKLLKFGIYSMLMTGSYAIINNVSYDQITATLGPEMNGIFTTCFFIAIIIELPKRNMGKVITPILSYELENNNIDEVRKIYKRSSITMSTIGILIFIGLATNLRDLFDFIPKGKDFQVGYSVVIGVCLAKLVQMITSFGAEIISLSPLYKYNLLFQGISAAVLVILNALLIPTYGLDGAVISFFIAILLHSTMLLIFIRFQFEITPFTKSHVPLVLIGLLILVIAYLFQPSLDPIINISIRAILTIVLFSFLIYRFRISDDINRIIRSTFERFFKINLP